MTRRSSAGSVLLETLFVLPILLLLFGGLFVLGDLAHSRLHLEAVDRGAAWGSNSRFSEPVFREWFRYAAQTSALRLERVKSGRPRAVTHERGSQGEERARLDMPRGNHWLGFYAGYAHAKASIPFWVGMANAHSTLFGGPEEDRFADERRLHVYEEDVPGTDIKAGDYREFGRAFAVHRAPGVSGASNVWSRHVPAQNLAWQAVVGDRWCGTDVSSGVSPHAPGSSFRRHPIALFLGE